MRIRSKLLIAAFTAAAVMAVAVSSASARRIETTEQKFRIVWTELEFLHSTDTPVRCPVTLEGSYHSRTISKVSGQLVGYINVAAVGATCTGGSARVLAETLPWHVQYNSFAGTLPNITAVTQTLIGVRFQIRNSSNLTCLAGTTQTNPAWGEVINEAAGATKLRALTEHSIPLGGSFVCEFAGNGEFRGTGEITTPGATTRIRIRLVQ
jgi:hypothetical protein